jgi:hypothetical protein
MGGPHEFGVSFVDFFKGNRYSMARVRRKPVHVVRNRGECRPHNLQIFIENLRRKRWVRIHSQKDALMEKWFPIFLRVKIERKRRNRIERAKAQTGFNLQLRNSGKDH